MKKWILYTILLLIVSFWMYHKPLLEDRPDYFEVCRDLSTPISMDNFLSERYPLWTSLSISSRTHIESLAGYVIIYSFGVLFNLHIMTLREIVWFLSKFFQGFSMFVLSYMILKKNFGEEHKDYYFLGSIISALLYMINSYVGTNITHESTQISYAFTPILFLLFIKTFEKRSFRYLVLTSLLWMIFTVYHNWILYSFIILFLSFLYNIVFNIQKARPFHFLSHFLNSFLVLLIFCIFYFLFSAYWLFPTLILGHFKPGYDVTIENLKHWSEQFGPMMDVLLNFDAAARWRLYDNPPIFFQHIWISTLLIFMQAFIIFFAYTAILLMPKNKDVYFFTLSAILFSLLRRGTNTPLLGLFYQWLCLDAPFHEMYNLSFRIPGRFLELSTFFITILVGFTTVNLMVRFSKIRGKKARSILSILLINLVVLSIMFPSWPLLTGDFNGMVKPTKIPSEFYIVNEWLKNQTGSFKVFWIPSYFTDTSWSPEVIKWFDFLSSSKPTYGVFRQARARKIDKYFEYIGRGYRKWSLTQKNNTNRLGQFLIPLNVKYLIFHDDIPRYRDQNKLALTILNSQKDLKLVFKQGFIYVYENLNPISPVFIPSKVIATNDVLKEFTKLTLDATFNAHNITLISKEYMKDIFLPNKIKAKILNYVEIDTTKRIVTVNATTPFILALAEAYDPLWVARINGEEVKSIPLYSVINGFPINKTGVFNIVLVYKPQEFFYYGLTITIISVILTLSYILGTTLRRILKSKYFLFPKSNYSLKAQLHL